MNLVNFIRRFTGLCVLSAVFLFAKAQDDIYLSLENRDLVKVDTRTCTVEVNGNTGAPLAIIMFD